MMKKIARRDWLKQTAGAAACAAVGGRSAAAGLAGLAPSPLPKGILNYNPDMGYRQLGKTDLWVSEIGLGGHYFYKGEEYMTQERRNEVVRTCLEAGINFYETTDTPGEDETTGEALRALGARKDVYITHDFCDIRRGEWDRQKTLQEATRAIETGLRNFHTDYLDIWRPSARQTGGTSIELMEWVLEAGVKAREAGKVRYLGLSCHNPKWLIQTIRAYPEFDMVIIPYNFLFRQAEKELFEIARTRNLGIMTIKPFLAESLFKREVPAWAKEHDSESGRYEGEYEHRTEGKGTGGLAVNALRFILSQPEISVVVPGMSTPQEVKTNVKAAGRKVALGHDRPLRAAYRAAAAQLPEHLRWLNSWHLA